MHTFNLPYFKDSFVWFDCLRFDDTPMFLDSCFSDKKNNQINRYDIICSNPFIKLTDLGTKTSIQKDGVDFLSDESFISIVDIMSEDFKKNFKTEGELPFEGGFIGYLAYEFNHSSDKFLSIPIARANAYKTVIIIDHHEEQAYLVSHEDKVFAENYHQKLLDQLNHPKKEQAKFNIEGNLEPQKDFEAYCKKFNKIQDYIVNGDVYQVNLATNFTVKYSGDPWVFYKQFRKINQSSYMAYINFEDFSIISGSPEQFISIKDNIIVSRPIKGTMPRGKDETSDEKLRLKLMSSEKDRAENLMIVDLIRNDLGKNCETGSVQVKDLFALESYPNVHHLVSTIEGKLLSNISAWIAYCDAFPGGSITGAPKQRSMEIISELEEFAREVYCGSIFYLSFSGSMNSNIAIRTLVAKNGVLNYFSGGGITRGSSAQSEFQEIQDKAANIENVITYFRRDNDGRENNQ